MINLSAKEKRMLVECAEVGFKVLEKNISLTEVSKFFSSPLVPAQTWSQGHFEDYLYSNNVDLFYSLLSVLYSTDDKNVINEVISRKDAKADFVSALDHIERVLYQESPFEQNLIQCVDKYTSQRDEEIKTAFEDRFVVTSLSLLDYPTDKSICFAKVNHGLWEFIRGAYDDKREVNRIRFRDIGVQYMLRAARTSGLTQLWGWHISRYLLAERSSISKGCTTFCVSLTAGIEAPEQSIRKDLSPVTRGAAIGLLSMFEAASPEVSHFQLGDGGATRALIGEKQLEEFFEKYISDTDACLFLVPPHLKMIDFVNYKGNVHKFLVPPSKINDTWKVVVATVLGYLLRMGKQYQTITILAQGASIASSLALLIAEIEDEFPNIRLRFFDLGRVLDVTVPAVLQKQAWAVRSLDEHIAEGTKVFCNASSANFVMATLIE